MIVWRPDIACLAEHQRCLKQKTQSCSEKKTIYVEMKDFLNINFVAFNICLCFYPMKIFGMPNHFESFENLKHDFFKTQDDKVSRVFVQFAFHFPTSMRKFLQISISPAIYEKSTLHTKSQKFMVTLK